MDNNPIEDVSVPRRLYKYRSFDLYSLRMLTNGDVYFSDPAHFNDPLDCKPEIFCDVSIDSLEALLTRMTAESSRLLHDCKSSASFYCGENEQGSYYYEAVISKIKETLYSQMGKSGVLSLAQNWNCPLMWSHYGDQHKGICLGFDTSLVGDVTPNKVNYEGRRCIKCSDLVRYFVEGNSKALDQIKETFFFTKAKNWEYEHEWRVVNHKSGEEAGPLELKGVYFGMRCDHAVKTAVLNLKHSHELEYYEISPHTNSFELLAHRVNAEDRQWYMPRPPARVAFSSLGL